MAVTDPRRGALSFAEQMRARAGALSRWALERYARNIEAARALGQEPAKPVDGWGAYTPVPRPAGEVVGEAATAPLRRGALMAEDIALGVGTLPFEARAAVRASGAIPTREELDRRARGEAPAAPAPMSSQMAQAAGLDYTPVPGEGPGFLERFAAEQQRDPRVVQRWRGQMASNLETLSRETGLSPLAVAGIESVIPLGPPKARVTPFVKAARTGQRVAESEKLLQRYRDLERLRRHVMGEAVIEDAADLKALQSRIGRLEGGREIAKGPAVIQPEPSVPIPGLKAQDPERAAELLRMAPKYRASDPRVPIDTVVEIGPEGAKRPVYFGRVSDNALTEMVRANLDEKQILESAGWYDEARAFVDSLSPNNRKLGAQLLAAWQVSQRNENTHSAWRKLMNVVLEEKLGQPVPMIREANVKKSLTAAHKELEALGTGTKNARKRAKLKRRIGELEAGLWKPRKTGALAHEDVRQILSGGDIGDEEIGLKLHDFLDSAYGKAVRTIAGDDPRGGAPAVVDVWMKRIQGVPDDASLNWLVKEAERAGDTQAVEKLEAIRAQLRADQSTQAILGRQVPSPHEYEFMAEQIRRLAAKWSEADFAGKSDWRPHEVQAVLWMTSLRQHGQGMIFPRAALQAGDVTTVGRAGRIQSLDELRQAWVVASSWVNESLDFDEATGWTAAVRAKVAEKFADELGGLLFGRQQRAPRMSSREAARRGVNPNLPTVTSATGRWRNYYEPSLLSYHPATTDAEVEAFAAAMGLAGRQKAVYIFREGEGADGLFFLRVKPKQRKAVSDALLAEGLEGQTVMDDGLALFDRGRANQAAIERVADRFGLEAELVPGTFDARLDFQTRGDAMARYRQILEQHAARVGMPKERLDELLDLAKDEGIAGSTRELAEAAASQRRARASGALGGARGGRGGPGSPLADDLSARALRKRIEEGVERRAWHRERRHAERRAGVLPSHGRLGEAGVGAPGEPPRMMMDFRPTEPGSNEFREWFGRSVVTEDDGSPLVVYGIEGEDGIASPWFTGFIGEDQAKHLSQFGRAVSPAYLKIERPLDLIERRGREAFVREILPRAGVEISEQPDAGGVRYGVTKFPSAESLRILQRTAPAEYSHAFGFPVGRLAELPEVQRAIADAGYDGVRAMTAEDGPLFGFEGLMPLRHDQVRSAITTETSKRGEMLLSRGTDDIRPTDPIESVRTGKPARVRVYHGTTSGEFDETADVMFWAAEGSRASDFAEDRRAGRFVVGIASPREVKRAGGWRGVQQQIEKQMGGVGIFDDDRVTIEGPFDTKAEAQEFLEAEVGSKHGRVLERRHIAPRVIRQDLELRNPLVVDAKGRGWNDLPVPKELRRAIPDMPARTYTDHLAQMAKRAGYDSVVIRNVIDSTRDTKTAGTNVITLGSRSLMAMDRRGAAMREARRGALGVPARATQAELPGVPEALETFEQGSLFGGAKRPQSLSRTRLPGSEGFTKPGALTADPTRSQPFNPPSETLARGALGDFRPLTSEEGLARIGTDRGFEAPGSQRLERGLEAELARYSYRPEMIGVEVPIERGNPISRIALIARPTAGEIEALKGGMLGTADAWLRNPEVIRLGEAPLDTRRVARLLRRVAEHSGLSFPAIHPMGLAGARGLPPAGVETILGGATTASGLAPGSFGGAVQINPSLWLQDALGSFRPARALMARVRHGLSDEQMRLTLAHEFGHALIGVRDKDMLAHYLISQTGGREWRGGIYDELVENSRLHARPQAWRDALAQIGAENTSEVSGGSKLFDVLEILGDAADREMGGSISIPNGYLRYLASGAELLADGVATVVRDPEIAKQVMPRFVKALRRLINDDPQLTRRGIEMAGFGGALLLAEEALRESDERNGGAL